MSVEQVKQVVYDKKIIAICRNVPVDRIVDTGKALYEGGIRMMEVTFKAGHEEDTLESIRLLNREFEGKVLVGAGTVTTVEQVEQAAAAGALYIISPNTDVDVIKKTKELGMLSMPGALTPSEIMTAWTAGADIVKLFPAAEFGVKYIKAVRAPLAHIPMTAVGGVNQHNMKDFLDVGIVGFGIGSNIVDLKLINAGEYGRLTELAKEYTVQFE